MRTEARKSFDHGFVLTEQELRRVVGVATEQVEKASASKPTTYIQVKLRNGTISEVESLDDLLSLENVGSKQIIRTRILIAEKIVQGDKKEEIDEEESPKLGHLIIIEFRNPEEDDDPRPISYAVRGAQRDWVFVTASELDERLTKVKCLSPRALFPPRGRPLFFTFAPLLFMLGLLGALIWQIDKMPPSAAQVIESQWKAGTLHDPIQAIIIEQKYYEASRSSPSPRVVFLAAIIVSFLLVTIVSALLKLGLALYPAYVFCWGDATKLYEKRVQARKYVLGVLIGGLIVGILASIIGNKLTPGR